VFPDHIGANLGVATAAEQRAMSDQCHSTPILVQTRHRMLQKSDLAGGATGPSMSEPTVAIRLCKIIVGETLPVGRVAQHHIKRFQALIFCEQRPSENVTGLDSSIMSPEKSKAQSC